MNKASTSALTLLLSMSLTACDNTKKTDAPTSATTETKKSRSIDLRGQKVELEQVMSTYDTNNARDAFGFALADYENVIIDFYADWCGPCRAMGVTFEKVASQYKDVLFLKVNIDRHGPLATEYKVRGIPTLLYARDGEIVDRTVGSKSERQFKIILKEMFNQ